MNIGIGSVSNIRISVGPVHVLTAQLQWALSLASTTMGTFSGFSQFGGLGSPGDVGHIKL